MVNVAIIEENQIVLSALKYVFDQTKDIKLVLACESGEDFLQNHSRYSIDVVIVEVGVYGTKDNLMLYLLSEIQQILPQVGVLVFTHIGFPFVIYECLLQQVRGFLMKPQGIEHINLAIKTIYDGGWFFSKNAFDVFKERPELLPNKLQPLTNREVEVVYLYAKGYLVKEICSELGICSETLRTHRKNIYKKWHLNSIIEVLFTAVRLKYLDPENLDLREGKFPVKVYSKKKQAERNSFFISYKTPYK